MLSTNEPMIDYDSKFDIMYYSNGDTSNSYGDEDIDNIVVVKDIDSDKVVGYTILNYKKMTTPNTESYTKMRSMIEKSILDRMSKCFNNTLKASKC